ncbi:MAG: type II toxin-antitoxin system RelE/ParE family toxin [Candidatus Thiodiazotropha sp.]
MLVSYSDAFKRQLKRLNRKYRRIRSDVEPLITQLEAGETPGDQIQGTGYTVYKVRVKNSDAQRGKSGGYRVIYYLATQDSVLLVSIYSKTEQSDIDDAEVARIISEEES